MADIVTVISQDQYTTEVKSGVQDHRELIGRDAINSHPANTITLSNDYQFVTANEIDVWTSHLGSFGNSHGLANGDHAGFMDSTLWLKLDGVDENANYYIHPANHPANMIIDDAQHRWGNDTAFGLWDSKANGSHRHNNADAGNDGFMSNSDYALIRVAASETAVGRVELATAAETTTGTSSALAVTPAGLANHAKTVDQAISTAASNTGTLAFLMSWLSKQTKAITGKTNWYDTPDLSLSTAKTRLDNTSGFKNKIINGMFDNWRYPSSLASVTTVSRATNVATVTTVNAHGLMAGDTVSVYGITTAGFSASVTVASVPTANSFTYANSGTDVGSTSETGGKVKCTSRPIYYLASLQNINFAFDFNFAEFGATGPVSSGKQFIISRIPFAPGQTDIPGAAYYLHIECTNAGTADATSINLTHFWYDQLELFANRALTTSLYAKSSTSSTLSLISAEVFGTGGAGPIYTTPLTQALTTSWAQYNVTHTPASIAGKTIGAGSCYSQILRPPLSGTWSIDIADYRLEYGSSVTANELRPVSVDLAIGRNKVMWDEPQHGTLFISAGSTVSPTMRVQSPGLFFGYYADCQDVNGAAQNPTGLTITFYVVSATNGNVSHTTASITTAASVAPGIYATVAAGDTIRAVVSNTTGLTGGINITPRRSRL